MSKTRFTTEVEYILLKGGWHQYRNVFDKVTEWRTCLDSKNGFEMSDVAEKILKEFGGLTIGDNGVGFKLCEILYSF